MRRRLRKKLRLGEFREYGFQIRADLTAGTDPVAVLWRLVEAAEERGLVFGGGGDNPLQALVMRPERGGATEADRETFRELLWSNPAVSKWKVGPLVDAWHGPWKDL